MICRNAEAAIEFYKNAFGAEEIMRFGQPGMVGHCEMRVGKAIFMLADEFPENGAYSPKSIGGSPVSMLIYVDDVDGFTENAIGNGLTVLRPVADMFYGDRIGFFEDPFGHRWSFATHQEDLTPDEMKERAKAAHVG